MDFSQPLQSLIPGATGRVLGVLTQTTMPLSGRAIAELADVSPAQAARVLPKLVGLGVVESRSAPPAILYSFVPDHVAAASLEALSGLGQRFVERLGDGISTLDPLPAGVGAFGSFARRQAGPASDIDLLVIRPRGIGPDDDGWAGSLAAIASLARRLSGNQVEILEVGRAELPGLLRGGSALWRDIVRDFLPVHGLSLHEV